MADYNPEYTSVLDDAFPERNVEDVNPTGPSWNDRNETVCVEFSDGERIFLKVAVDGDGSRIARERAVIDYVEARCDVALPSVLATETDGEIPYLVTAPMDERDLYAQWSDLTADGRADAVRRVGAALAEIHTRSFERHGHVAGGDADGLVLETRAWTDVLVDRIELMREIGSSDRFDHHFDEVTAAVEANRNLLDDAPATLVHGDPAQPNCFVDDAAVGFVDWELAHVGDSARELHRARDQLLSSGVEHEARLVETLHDGYRERAGSLPVGLEERTPVYDAVRQLGRSGFFDKWAALADEPPAELATQVDDEMERRLERI